MADTAPGGNANHGWHRKFSVINAQTGVRPPAPHTG